MDAARAVLLLKARLDELERLSTANRDFEEWRQRTELTLRRVFHDDHKLVKDFQQVSFYPMAYPADAADYQRNFDSGRDSAVAVLKGAVYEVEELTELADFASGASIDPELWEHVEHLVEQEQWDQAASQTAIFVESRIRQWAGRPDSETTTRLMTAVLRPNGGVFPLGRTDAETEGWHQLGRGFVGAVRNVATHRIDQRDDAKRYAMGVLGAGSLLLTQLRYEHGNRFRS